MENKLTQAMYYADNVLRSTTGYEVNPLPTNMDENLELDISQDEPVEKKDEKTEEELKIEENLTESQKKVKQRWEEFFKKRKGQGVEVTDEQKKIAYEAIKKGHSPEHEVRIAGGAGDDRFSDFNVDEFRNTAIEPLARELKETAERGEITPDFINQLSQRARQNLTSEEAEQASNDFIERINRIISEDQIEQGQAQQGRQNAQNQAPLSPEDAVLQENLSTLDGDVVAGGGGQELSIEELLRRRVEASLLKKEARSSNPRSVQEVALSIINDEGADRWGPNGTFPLIKQAEDANGIPLFKERRVANSRGEEEVERVPLLELRQENFIRWFRERMMYHHLNNSRDETLQLGNLVGVQSEFGSTISVFSMDKDRAQYFLDEVSGMPLDELANQMKMELWLFGNMRNYDLLYQKYMGSDSDLPKFLAQLHDKEEITQPGSLQTIMTLPESYKKKVRRVDSQGREIEEEVTDTSVGDGIRKAYEIYYYISDLDKLKEVLGEDAMFFKREGFVEAFKVLEKLNPDATYDDLSSRARIFIESIFDGDKINEKKFITALNPFNEKNKPEFNKSITREMVRQVLSHRYGLDNGLNPENTMNPDGTVNLGRRDIVRKDLEYSEAFAWVMTRWTGAAARNDTSAIGFDAFTKTIKFRDYRKRQSNEKRAGQFGNEYDLPVFKGLTADFFNGVTVERRIDDNQNYTPFEIFRKISEIEDNPNLSEEDKKREKNEWAERLNFEQYIQRSYSADHINRAFEIFHSTLGAEELRLEEIVKWDPFRGVIFDRGKFEEQVKEKFIKPTRYAFSTYAQLDMGKKIRVQTGGFGSGDLPVYKEMTMAESLFGPEVTSQLRPLAEDYYKDKLGKGRLSDEEKEEGWSAFLSDSSPEGGRALLWKKAVMARIATHIKSHREFGNGYAPFTAGMVNILYDALERIKSVEIEEEGDETVVNYNKRFLSEDEIKWIKKMSGTTGKDLFINDFLIKGIGWGATKGTWEGLNVFVRDIFK